MKASELRGKTAQELTELLGNQHRADFKLRLQKSAGDLTKTDQFKKIRRDIARINTRLTEIKGAAK